MPAQPRGKWQLRGAIGPARAVNPPPLPGGCDCSCVECKMQGAREKEMMTQLSPMHQGEGCKPGR